MEDKNKTTNEAAEVSAETLDKLASRDADVRQSGLSDTFEQHLPQIPKDYGLKKSAASSLGTRLALPLT